MQDNDLQQLVYLAAFAGINIILLNSCWRIGRHFSNSLCEKTAVSLVLSFSWIATASMIAAWGGFYHLAGMALMLAPVILISFYCNPKTDTNNYEKIAYREWQPNKITSWIVILPHAWFLIGWIRAIAEPPRSQDALVYHLTRAAYWVQDGGFASRYWPKSLAFYDFFSPAGDFLWAWTFLAGLGDSLLFLAYAFVWILLSLSIWILGGAFGLKGQIRSIATSAALASPSIMAASNAAYVDNLFAALLAFSLAAFIKYQKGYDEHWLRASLLTLSVAALTKFTATPILIAEIALLPLLLKNLASTTRILHLILACSPFILWTAWTYINTESITYPFQLISSGVTLFSGDTTLSALLQQGVEERSKDTFITAWLLLLMGPINLGRPLLVILPIGLIGIFRLRNTLPYKALIVMAIYTLTPLAGALTPTNNALITIWIHFLGRHLLISAIILTLASATIDEKWVRFTLGASILINCAYRLSYSGLTLEELEIVLKVTYPAIFYMAALVSVYSLIKNGIWVKNIAWMGTIGLLITTYYAVLPARDINRLNFFNMAKQENSFEIHPAPYDEEIELWNIAEASAGKNIAFVSLFQESSYRHIYPLFGSRLQNHVEMVDLARSFMTKNEQSTPTQNRILQPWMQATDIFIVHNALNDEFIKALSRTWIKLIITKQTDKYQVYELIDAASSAHSPAKHGSIRSY